MRRAVRTVLTAAVLAGVVVAPGLPASAAPSTDKTPARGTAAAPARVAPCTLTPAAHSAEPSEWASCLQVGAELTAAPAVGGTATLLVTVRSQRPYPGVRIEMDLPAVLGWEAVPDGTTRQTVPSRAPETGGRLDRATTTAPFAADELRRWQGTVRAGTTGTAQIRVRALVDRPDGGVDAAEESVFLTVGRTAGESRLSIGSGAGKDLPTMAVPAGTRIAGGLTSRRAERTPAARPPTTNAGSTACITGTWNFTDGTGVTRASASIRVQAWDRDPAGGDDLLTSGTVEQTGHYTLCFGNEEAFGDRQDVYARFVTDHDHWRVESGGNAYAWVSSVVNDVADGSTTNFGFLQPAGAGDLGALRAFSAVNDAWLFVPGDCWDDLDTYCKKVTVVWSAGSTENAAYRRTTDKKVHLGASDPDSHILVVHEVAHSIMDDVYEYAYPLKPNCNPHYAELASSAGCAWTEGFAEWFPATVYGDPAFRWPSGHFVPLETPTWGTEWWGAGDTVEGRVAGALIDLSDAANESPWDRLTDGATSTVWSTFLNHVSGTFAEFWAHRASDGFAVNDAVGRSALYQNTIDYDFRDPMANYAPATRPGPTPHNFSYWTSMYNWTVVGVRPAPGSDVDLVLWDDRPLTSPLVASSAGSSTIDFVAVDSNYGRRPFGDFYPQVTPFAGIGTYAAELAQGTGTLPAAGSTGVPMSATSIVAVRNSYATAGVPVTITVTPQNGGQDAELFVLSSTATSGTWLRSRSTASASSTGAGPGGVEQVTFTPTSTGSLGVVVVNRAGSGTYTLSRT